MNRTCESTRLSEKTRYTAFGETDQTIVWLGSLRTQTPKHKAKPLPYTGQRNYGDFGLMDYNARFYSPSLGRFVQPDTVLPEPGNAKAFDRYSYVDNNPTRYLDPSGHYKIIILYGSNYSEETNAFQAAAETTMQQYLDQGYSKDDILCTAISTDDQFLQAISDSGEGEIEQMQVFAHGYSDSDDGGGIQLSGGAFDERQVEKNDLGSKVEELADRFAPDASITINACKVGKGGLFQDSFAQELANTLDVTVYAYKQKLKFWEYNNGDYSPYDAGGVNDPNV